jgi:hypothetical protein
MRQSSHSTDMLFVLRQKRARSEKTRCGVSVDAAGLHLRRVRGAVLRSLQKRARRSTGAVNLVKADAAVEIWRPVVGHPTYEVGSLGHVRHARTKRMKCCHEKKPCRHHSGGYLIVTLIVPDPAGHMRGHLTVHVHRLVLEAFAGPRPEGAEGSHLNGDRLDARACNLAWETHAENAARRCRAGDARWRRTGSEY